jgi:multimeric flavodoxin WrbA
MKVLLTNGSPHADGYTAKQLRIVEEALHEDGIETVWWQLGTKPVRGCIDCQHCTKTHRCAFDDDGANELIDLLDECDGVVLGSPVYFAGGNGAFTAICDRAFYATCNWESTLRGKVGASVVNLWRAGATTAIDNLNKYFYASQMIVATSNYWPLMHNGEHTEREDRFGAKVMRNLGHNIAKLLKG